MCLLTGWMRGSGYTILWKYEVKSFTEKLDNVIAVAVEEHMTSVMFSSV